MIRTWNTLIAYVPPIAALMALAQIANAECTRPLDQLAIWCAATALCDAKNDCPSEERIKDWTEESVDDLDGEFFVITSHDQIKIWCGIFEPPVVRAQRGTILVLHGIRQACSRSPDGCVHKMGRRLAEAGYRVVLVDLRGHGRSGGSYITHGVLERRDLADVITVMERQRWAVGPIGVFGYSYGGGIALQLAAHDERVKAVVAVAAPVNLQKSMPNFFRNVLVPAPVAWRFKYLKPHEYESVLHRAAWLYGFDPDDADASRAMSQVSVPIKLIYGEDDAIAPVSFGEAFERAAKGACELKILPAFDDQPSVRAHLRLMRSEQEKVGGEAIKWFDAHLASN